jgi:hypothetical protein
MPRVLRITLVLLVLVALASGTGSWLLSDTHDEREFWSALLLHLFAELTIFATGLWITYVLATKLAGEKIKAWIILIAKMRRKLIIDDKMARGAVMCAAKVFSEEQLKKGTSMSIMPKPQTCIVCSLKYQTTDDRKCEFCGLHDHVWKLTEEEINA